MKKRISIKTIAAIITISFMGILTMAIAALGYKLYRDSVMERYITYTDTVLEYAYCASTKYAFGDMISARDMPGNYEVLRSELNLVKESSDIEYLYAVYFEDLDDIHSLHYAINAKTAEELAVDKPISEIYSYMGKPCEEGAFKDDALTLLRDAVRNGKTDSGTLEGDSDGYGYMLNGYRVVFDSMGRAAGLICVEIDINRIHVELRRYVSMVLLTATIITAVVILIYLIITEHFLIKPIVRIAESSDDFVQQIRSNSEPEALHYEDVPVKTGGELRVLANDVRSLADGVASYMTNLKAATAERERIGTELTLATQIQTAILPHSFPPYPTRTEFDIYALMDPAREVGGDFYDFFLIDDDHLCLVMADVAGKGIPAALFMMIAKTILHNCAMLGKSPADILKQANESICSNNQVEMFVTIWLGILEISSGKLIAANAGHEYPVLKHGDGAFEIHKDKHSFAVGGMEGIRYKEYEIQMNAGDKLFLYTDGVPEAADAAGEMFRCERMLDALNACRETEPQALLEYVRKAVSDFVKDAEQFDDLTMMCLEYKGGRKEQS